MKGSGSGYFKILPWHSLAEVEENHEKHQSG
jgi:hypothetical protein